MKFTFHNRGTVTSFTPDKLTKDNAGNRITTLELHKELVRDANRRDVYIMDQKGRDVDCTSVVVSLKQAA
jgi:hypothetical protein